MAKLANVMIVDDNPRCLEFMTLAFAAQGSVAVTSELKPVTALDRIRSEKPDLVVLDVKMPELDGFGLLAVLRAEGNSVPVVMCSGSALQKDVDRAYAGGCSGYMEKPTTLEDYRALAGAVVGYWARGELLSIDVAPRAADSVSLAGPAGRFICLQARRASERESTRAGLPARSHPSAPQD